MTRMPELSPTVFTGEATLVVVDQHVIVEAVLSCERCVTYKADKRFEP